MEDKYWRERPTYHLDRDDEKRMVELIVDRIKVANQYPDYLFDEKSAMREGLRLYKEHFGEYTKITASYRHYSPDEFRIRPFLPEDFGLKTFSTKFKRTEKFEWISRHYHEEGVRVIVSLMTRRTPLFKMIGGEARGYQIPLQLLPWVFDKKTDRWFSKLEPPLIIPADENLKLDLYPLPMEKIIQETDIDAEEIADSIQDKPWIKCEVEPVGMFFIRAGEWSLRTLTHPSL